MVAKEIFLVDTSIAIAAIVADHNAHQKIIKTLEGYELGLAGHAFFETYSVLTRLPAPARRKPVEVLEILQYNFPKTKFLSARSAVSLAKQLAELSIAGGSVYDALVGAVSREHELRLITRDRRAVDVYRAIGTKFRLVE